MLNFEESANFTHDPAPERKNANHKDKASGNGAP